MTTSIINQGVSPKIIKRVSSEHDSYIITDFSHCDSTDAFFSDSSKPQIEYFLEAHAFLSNSVGHVPAILTIDRTHNTITAEDAGDVKLQHLWANHDPRMLTFYLKSIDLIIDLQQVSPSSSFRKYNDTDIYNELHSFVLSCLHKNNHINHNHPLLDSNEFYSDLHQLASHIYSLGHSVVHRDFQSTNILIHNNDISIVDFQDLCLGPIFYDIVSLLCDLNVCLDDSTFESLLNYFWHHSHHIGSYIEFKHNFFICGLHRVMQSMCWRSKAYFSYSRFDLLPQLQRGITLLNFFMNHLDEFPHLFNALHSHLPSSTIAIILAAGKGTRMNTDVPKAIVPLLGTPMVQYVINNAKNAFVDHISIVVGYKKQLVIDCLENECVSFVVQSEQLGTGHAVLQTKHLYQHYHGDILVLMADAPLLDASLLQELLQFHKINNYDATMLSSVQTTPTTCGRIIRDKHGFFLKTIEAADLTDEYRHVNEIATGAAIYKASPLFKQLDRVNNFNAQKEYYLPDVLALLVQDGKRVGIYKTNKLFSVHSANNRDELATIENFLSNNH